MADTTDGWIEPDYNIDISIKYKGIYSKYVDEIYFRGEHNLVEQYGFSVKENHGRYPNYSFYQTLDKYYSPNDINSINIDKLIRRDLLRVSDMMVSENDIILCEREFKLNELVSNIRETKKLKNRIKRLFKR
jgi:hypothetical protein